MINASNPSLINILLQQAAKTKDKKRPTFEEVFTKLNARTTRMNANKNPMNNMLTNEQLFRYYLKETAPKLQVSDEGFNIQDALNPMQEANPNKVYGSSSVQTSDIIPSRDPSNNAGIIGVYKPPPGVAPAARAPGAPISSRFANLIQQSRVPTAPAAPAAVAAAAPVGVAVDGQVPTPAGVANDAVALSEADVNYKEAIAVNNRLEAVNYSTISQEAQMLLKILFGENYQDQSNYFLKQLIDGRSGGMDNAVSGLFDLFYQIRLNKPTNDFLNNRIAGIVGADFTAGSAVKEEFDKLYNLNNVSEQEFFQNISKNISSGYFTDREKARMDRELTTIDGASLADTVGQYLNTKEQDYYRIYGNTAISNALDGDLDDPFKAFNKAADDERNAEAVFEGLMEGLFNDMATEIMTNTDINSTVLDPELVKNLAERAAERAAASKEKPKPSPVSILNPAGSADITEAGSGEVNIADVITKRGRGVQPGDIRGSYEKPKKFIKDILGDVISGAVEAAEAKPKKKK
jgi:hypothetical protein